MQTKSFTFASISATLYLASILWCSLFPLISVTTGELKPRGLYLDENALLVSRGLSGLLSETDAKKDLIALEDFLNLTDGILKIENFEEQYCSYLKSNFVSLSCQHFTKSMRGTTQINVDHPWKPRSLEVTVVTILYHVSNKLQSFTFATALVQKMVSSDWLSKRVLILLIPLEKDDRKSAARKDNASPDSENAQKWVDDSDSHSHSGARDTRYSAALSAWLHEYHTQEPSDTSTEKRFMSHAGLLRDSYVIDFSEPMITTVPARILMKGSESGQPKAASFWSKIQLLVAGNNGQLPNLDILAAPLAAFPDVTINEADRLAVLQSGEGVCASSAQWLLSKSCSWCSLLLGAGHCEQYFSVLLGLFAFSEALLTGPTGLHGQFIRRNIDSLTLRPIAVSAPAGRMGNAQHAQPRSEVVVEVEEGADWAAKDLASLVTIVEHCVRYSSNLHGEH